MLDRQVVAWVLSRPGLIVGATPSDVENQALERLTKFAGGNKSVSPKELMAALNRCGYRVDAVRDEYRLALPGPHRSGGLHFHAKRLGNTRDRRDGLL